MAGTQLLFNWDLNFIIEQTCRINLITKAIAIIIINNNKT